ncbi:hypothetical protein [Enterococcus sp. AZ189]|uniref:hypothetical protein n=1 Tax=Enterococcus sp. AZ189 TaxID=2774871 RepID=UPI003F68926E
MNEFKSKMGYTESQFYPGVIGTVDFSKRYIPRFKYFLSYLNAIEGDRYYIQEYSFWVMSKWKEFDKLKGFTNYYPKTDEIQNEFDDFLKAQEIQWLNYEPNGQMSLL